MHIRYTACWLPKGGSRADEYEDAFSPAPLAVEQGDLPEFLCAVADGATETSFSGLWAQILVEAFVNKRLQQVDAANVIALAQQWHAVIDERTRAKPLPWYAEEKLRSGAYSSLLGLYLRDNGAWYAVSVGDSCLVQRRPRVGYRSFPYNRAAQFDNRPALISTHAEGFTVTLQRGTWEDGDTFLLMTDALAHFYLAHPRYRARFASLEPADFASFIESARRDKLCRNDDVTLLRICPNFGAVGSDVDLPQASE